MLSTSMVAPRSSGHFKKVKRSKAIVGVFANHDVSVFSSDGHRKRVGRTHHHAFHNRLPANQRLGGENE